MSNIDWNKGSFYHDRPSQDSGRKSSGYPGGGFGNWKTYRPSRAAGFIDKYKFIIQVAVSVLIFAVAVVIHDRQDPVSTAAVSGFKWLLTTDINFEPILDKAVKIAFQGEGVEWPFLGSTDIGDTAQASADSVNMAIPVSGTVSKQYGWVMDEIEDFPRFHEGIDISAKEGTSVQAVLDGQVRKVGKDEEMGNYVLLSHASNYLTLYGHLAEVAVKEGQLIKVGDQLGSVGVTGNVKEPLLHFEVREKGRLVNPVDKLEIKPDGV